MRLFAHEGLIHAGPLTPSLILIPTRLLSFRPGRACKLRASPDSNTHHPPSSGPQINPNPFVETALSYALTYISRAGKHGPSRSIKPARLTILADNDYYSQPPGAAPSAVTITTHSPPSSLSSSSSSTPQPPQSSRFIHIPVPLHEAHKTGLGSSAALVTALTAALLSHHLPRSAFDPASARGRRLLHNLAQAAHCAAQGKVGSGFDVAAAVYGGCLYRRFSPRVLAGLSGAGTPGFASKLEAVVEDRAAEEHASSSPSQPVWDAEIVAGGAALPPGVAVRMCDVDCGSQTVGMVKKVLAWRDADSQAARALWDALQGRNEGLAAALREGRTGDIPACVAGVRELVRRMGAESGVPIEPESQTALLDALGGVEGVYGGVVPGAGGFDAVALLVKDDKETEARIEEFLAAWSKEKGERVSLLRVKGEMEGVKVEELETYHGWLR